MQKNAMHIAIYGVLAATPLHAPATGGLLTRIKLRVKLLRDLLRSRLAPDYRDYGGAHAYNVGDVAISETIRRLLVQAAPDCIFSNVDWGDIEALRAVHRSKPIDLLVVAGSGYFQFDSAGRLAPHLEQARRFLAETGIRYAFFGVGINQPFSVDMQGAGIDPEPASAALLRALLEGADLISVRDDYSADLLAAYTEKAVHMVGDPALHVATALGLEQHKPGRNGAPLIGINLSFHGPTSNRLLLENLSAYVDALLDIQRRTGCRFRYIVHHGSEYPIPRLLRRRGVELDIVHAALPATAAAYRDLDLHIGGMLHSCILSASSGTPWIAIAYDIKHHGFNACMGMDGYCLNAPGFDPARLSALALQALAQNADLREAIQTRRAHLHKGLMTLTATMTATEAARSA